MEENKPKAIDNEVVKCPVCKEYTDHKIKGEYYVCTVCENKIHWTKALTREETSW
jgi:ribosomal protein L37AE/L43A